MRNDDHVHHPGSDTGFGAGLATTVATATTIAAVLPVFLFGGLSALIARDLPVGPTTIGLATAAYFGAAAASSIPAGRLTERIGERRGLLLGLGLAAISLTGLGLATTAVWHVIGWLILGGVGNGMVQPAANLLLSRRVPIRTQGLAFGTKQAAIPIATLSAGAAVPLIGLTVGWRWAFVLGAVLAAPIAWTLLRPARTGSGRRRRGSAERSAGTRAATARTPGRVSLRGRRLLSVSIGGACGAAAANSLGAFHVSTLIDGGVPVATAGALLSLGSVAAVLTRLAVGWSADRVAVDQLRVCLAMLTLGAVGYLALSSAGSTLTFAFASVVAFAAGWGWPGLLHLAVVRENPDAPAAASGATQTGLYVGGVVGPALFGLVAGSLGFPFAWRATGVVALLGALTLLVRRPPEHAAEALPEA